MIRVNLRPMEVQINDRGMKPVPAYDENDWIDTELDRKDQKVVMHSGFENTH